MGYYSPDRKYYAGPLDNVDTNYLLTATEIEEYFSNSKYNMAFLVWSRFHLNMGFPFSGGWAEQPVWISHSIALLEECYNEEQTHKHNKEIGKGKGSKPSKYNTETLKG